MTQEIDEINQQILILQEELKKGPVTEVQEPILIQIIQLLNKRNLLNFKVIPRFPGYAITRGGNVFNLKNGKLRKTQIHHTGYPCLTLRLNGKITSLFIHRLLADAFIPNPHNKPQVNHINGIKIDNRVENLEWVTDSENKFHAHKIGLYDAQKSRVYQQRGVYRIRKPYRVNVSDAPLMREMYNNGISQATIANHFKISQSHISRILRNVYYADGGANG